MNVYKKPEGFRFSAKTQEKHFSMQLGGVTLLGENIAPAKHGWRHFWKKNPINNTLNPQEYSPFMV